MRINKDFVISNKPSIEQILKIKSGGDYTSDEGERIKNENVTLPKKPAITYAYCSDTAYHLNLVKHIENVDLLYHEATFDNKMEDVAKDKQHATAAQAAAMAKKAKVGKLLLGHYSARFDDLSSLLREAQSIFPETLLSEEGKTYEIES